MYFHEMEKLLPMEGGRNIWKIDKKNGFHKSQNPFLLAAKESFKNMFSLEEKIKLSVARMSENERKKNGFQ